MQEKQELKEIIENGRINLLPAERVAENILAAGYRQTFNEKRFENNMRAVLEIEKKQAVKEFARKVKKCSYCDNVFMDGKWHRYVFVDDIDKLLKEYEK